MSIEKLELVSIAGRLEQLDPALTACLQSGVFHIENAVKMLGGGDDSGSRSSGANPYAEPLKALAELDLRQIAANAEQDDFADSAEYTPEQILSEARRIAESLRNIREGIAREQKQIAECESAEIHLKNLAKADIDLGELTRCKHILYRFGRMPEENMQKLAFYGDDGFVFQAYHTAHEYVWGFYFAAKDQIPAVDAIMKGLLFERYELPEGISGTPEQALENLNTRRTECKAALEQLEQEQAAIYRNEAPELVKLYRYAKYRNEVYRLRSQCILSRDKFNLMGYVPVSEKAKFQKELESVPDLSVSYEAPWTDSRFKPPVRLKNGWFTKPFAMFVEMFGLPSYTGYNPTLLLAITYTVLFGIMFGDLGQGFVIALIGLIVRKKTGNDLGGIMTRIGVSSMIFGTLYGAVFGFEDLLDPVYRSLGISFLPLHAMEHTNFIIFTAVGIGAFIVLLSIFVNIVVRLKQHNYEEGLFGSNGAAGLVFYSGLLLIVIGLVTGRNFATLPVIVGMVILPLLVMFFREPLGHIAAHKHFDMPPMGDFIASNFFECFEYCLSYASNTLSFIRVGGFVFSHIGLMSTVFLLADLIGKDHTSILTVIIGNLFVMGLEGLLVGIQVMRLEFYEIFSRCYDGDGKPFTPVSVSFDELAGQPVQPETTV